MNTAWFLKRIAESPYGSQRQLALKLGMDPAAFGRMLHGERDMSVGEAADLAEALELPVEEVVRQAVAGSRGRLPAAREGWPKGKPRGGGR